MLYIRFKINATYENFKDSRFSKMAISAADVTDLECLNFKKVN